MEWKISSLYFGLLSKDVDDELESFMGVKRLYSLDKFTLVDHLHVKNVVYETDEQIYLGNDDHDRFSHLLIHNCLQKTLEAH